MPARTRPEPAQATTGRGKTAGSRAIKADFILSAEIMAITLAALPEGRFWMRAAVLAVVAVGITATVYRAVALVLKADDAGPALRSDASAGASDGPWSRACPVCSSCRGSSVRPR